MLRIHVLIVSDQLLPNLIPALMEKPERALLVASHDMHRQQKPKRLQKLLQDKQIDTSLKTGVPSNDLKSIREYALKLAIELKQDNMLDTIILNATGGNKLMSLAFVEVFREIIAPIRLRIIYTDTAHNVIETIFPAGLEPMPLQSVLDVPTYLAAQGMIYRKAMSDDPGWIQNAMARKPVTKYLTKTVVELDNFLGFLNRVIHANSANREALDKGGQPLIDTEHNFTRTPTGHWKEAMNKLTESGLTEWEGSTRFHIKDADTARYLSGFWLEELAWHTARDCGLQDVRCGVEFTWEGTAKRDAPRNEFDLLTLHNNRLLVIECKTLRLNQEDVIKEQNIATKLECIGRNAGGTFGALLLLSARKTSEPFQSRCRSLRIPLLEAPDIKRLKQELMAWRDGGTLTL